MKPTHYPPETSYGILQRNEEDSPQTAIVEQVRTLGYSVLDAGYSPSELHRISEDFDQLRRKYIETHGAETLRALNEYHTVRSPLTLGAESFIRLASNDRLLSTLRLLIQGSFILNQQNCIVNPAKETYNQASWHRDLPYQHFVASSPLAINALFCVDDFTLDNGATFVLPASHLQGAFPSQGYIAGNSIQIEAKAGSFILLDCMTFHAGGFNNTSAERRAVNHIYNIPYFKQQINLPKNLPDNDLSPAVKALLGFQYQEPASVTEYFASRKARSPT